MTVSAEASAIVVGAGLSGLVAAQDLVAAAIDDVVVLEARDRVGGRIGWFTRPNGRELMTGSEFTGSAQPQLQSLATRLGLHPEPVPGAAASDRGRLVRLFEGRRYVEHDPLDADPAAADAYAAAIAAIDALVAEVPPHAPWLAARAQEWDRQTIGQWLDAVVVSGGARNLMEVHLGHFGDVYEVSLLHMLWFFACFGGWAQAHRLNERFADGMAQIPRRLAERLGGRVVTSCPVRRIVHGKEGVLVEHDAGSTRAQAVIAAMEPGQVSKIEFDPPLPAARDRLQSRWLAGHGAKFVAIYDTPFWREDGLAGVGMGPPPFAMTRDVSPAHGDEGVLLAAYFGSGRTALQLSELMTDPQRCRSSFLETLTSFFGPRALEPQEYYAFDWSGDHWSQGCGTQLPPGLLSTVGPTLRAPIGRVVWAGADTGDRDWMEGAVTAGQRAAREALALVG
jgi:monoamine oxidase